MGMLLPKGSMTKTFPPDYGTSWESPWNGLKSYVVWSRSDPFKLRGDPKHKFAFLGVFTVKEHNGMSFDRISVQI